MIFRSVLINSHFNWPQTHGFAEEPKNIRWFCFALKVACPAWLSVIFAWTVFSLFQTSKWQFQFSFSSRFREYFPNVGIARNIFSTNARNWLFTCKEWAGILASNAAFRDTSMFTVWNFARCTAMRLPKKQFKGWIKVVASHSCPCITPCALILGVGSDTDGRNPAPVDR